MQSEYMIIIIIIIIIIITCTVYVIVSTGLCHYSMQLLVYAPLSLSSLYVQVLTSLLSQLTFPFSISSHQLKTLILCTCQRPSLTGEEWEEKEEETVDYRWACHSIQSLIVGLVLREKKLIMEKKKTKGGSREDIEGFIERASSSLVCIESSLDNATIDREGGEETETLTTVDEENGGVVKAKDEDNKSQPEGLVDILSTDSISVGASIQDIVLSVEESSDSSDDSHVKTKPTPPPPPPPPPLSSTTTSAMPKKILKSSKSTTSLLSSLHSSLHSSLQKIHHVHKKLSIQEKASPIKKQEDATNPVKNTTSSLSSSSYSSYIVSNSVDARLESSTLLPAELALQVMVRGSYQSLLDSIRLARPVSGACLNETNVGREDKHRREKRTSKPASSNLKYLLDAFESIYHENIASASLSSVDTLSLLNLWNEVCHSLVKGVKKKVFSHLISGSSDECGLFSPLTLSRLFDHLLSTTPADFQLCHVTLSLVHCHLKACQLVGGSDVTCVRVGMERMRLKRVIRHCCLLEDEGKESFLGKQDVVFIKLLTRLAGVRFVSEEEERGEGEDGANSKGEKGVNILLSVLVQVLQEK